MCVRFGDLSAFVFYMRRRPPAPTLFPYTTLFRSACLPWRTSTSSVTPPTPTSIVGSTRSRAFVMSAPRGGRRGRSEEHTSELQSHSDLVCRLLLEKKKNAKLTGFRATATKVTQGI